MPSLRTLRRQARLARHLAVTAGPGWLLFRAAYTAQLRSGLMARRLPQRAWADVPLTDALTDHSLADPAGYLAYRQSGAPVFFFSTVDREPAAEVLRGWDTATADPVQEAEELRHGRLRYFLQAVVQVGSPPDWYANPFSGDHVAADRHWSRISDFGRCDIKVIWEPSRFGFAYTLVRAYWRTGDEAYPELFWQWLENWRANNPPYCGPNWKCGQETSLRVMAWCFALHGFLGARATTAARVAALAQMIELSGRRVEATLGYALSQHNNHGISEGMGLWTIGSLFPELRAADRWRERGRAVLEAQGRELIYDDGAFSQHSVNYQRLMLHDYLWVLRLAELHGRPFSTGLKERVARAGEFLYQLQDEPSGHLPNYGQNDGALVLPLNNCDYADFRPVIQATRYLTTRTRTYAAGPWDEDLFWLFGQQTSSAPLVLPARGNLQATMGGYYTLRSTSGFAFTRCTTFRHRPGQADLLHVDIWWRGQNVALDAGTYSYHAPAPWNNSLAATSVHNTVTVDGHSQMEQFSTFLWLPWAGGLTRLRAGSTCGEIGYWEGEQDGYKQRTPSVAHRRGILRLSSEHWLVIDRLQSATTQRYRLHWLLIDAPYEHVPVDEAGELVQRAVLLHTGVGDYVVRVGSSGAGGQYSVQRADTRSTRGWQSLYYMCRKPAVSLALEVDAAVTTFWTLLGPAGASVQVLSDGLRVQAGAWQAFLVSGQSEEAPLLASIRLRGDIDDNLVLRP